MATTSKALFRGAATTTTTTTLYTVPSATTTVVTEIGLVNNSGSSVTFTISLDDVVFVPTITVGAYDAKIIPCKEPLATTKTIKGGASTATGTLIHIGGVEIA